MSSKAMILLVCLATLATLVKSQNVALVQPSPPLNVQNCNNAVSTMCNSLLALLVNVNLSTLGITLVVIAGSLLTMLGPVNSLLLAIQAVLSSAVAISLILSLCGNLNLCLNIVLAKCSNNACSTCLSQARIWNTGCNRLIDQCTGILQPARASAVRYCNACIGLLARVRINI